MRKQQQRLHVLVLSLCFLDSLCIIYPYIFLAHFLLFSLIFFSYTLIVGLAGLSRLLVLFVHPVCAVLAARVPDCSPSLVSSGE